MSFEYESHESWPPERFVVEVFSELTAETVQERWRDVNVLLRLAMLSGLDMQLEATLNLVCDLATEIAPARSALGYFWDEAQERPQLRLARGLEGANLETHARGNILNFWATRFSRPLLIEAGQNVQADAFLQAVEAQSAVVVPLFVSNRVMGTLQLFAAEAHSFSSADAQLLWILALLAETQLNREYANEGLIRFAFTDFLTGLKTRGYFEQQLELEIKRAERKRTKFSLLMIDIDYFKPLNDRYGHHVGDQVLRDVSSILMKDMREVDTVARYGGEEFVIVLPETTAPGALFVAQRLRKAVEAAKFFAGSPREIEHLTISIGIAVFDTDAQFKRDLIETADEALYAAKAQGRNQVMLYADVVAQRNRKEVS